MLSIAASSSTSVDRLVRQDSEVIVDVGGVLVIRIAVLIVERAKFQIGSQVCTPLCLGMRRQHTIPNRTARVPTRFGSGTADEPAKFSG